MPNPQIIAPAGYVTPSALAIADPTGAAAYVSRSQPVPTVPAFAAATAAPLTGTAGSSVQVGPFTPELGRAIWLTLTGSWTGTVTVRRSVDGGATILPLTAGGVPASFTGNAQEPVSEESVSGAAYYLDLALSGGSVSYVLRQ